MLFKQLSILARFNYGRPSQKLLKPGEELTRKSHKMILKTQDQEQSVSQSKEIRDEFELSLGTRYRNGFTSEELEGSNDMIKKALSLNNATPNQIMQYRIAQAVKKFQKWPLDTGTPGVQIAVMSERVLSSMQHLAANRQDTYGVRTFMKLLGQRRRMLNHLRHQDYNMYKWITTEYGIIDNKYGNPQWLEHQHKMPQKMKKYTRKETNRGRVDGK